MVRFSSIALLFPLFCLANAGPLHHKYTKPSSILPPCGCTKNHSTPSPVPVTPSPVPVTPAPAPAVHKCNYQFCRGPYTFKIGKATDTSFTKAICDMNGKKIGSVDESGEAKLIKGKKQVDISKWAPVSLKQNFDPTFFKTFAVSNGKHAGVGHQTMQQNQKYFLKDEHCWILPFKAFQILDKYGNAKEKHTDDPKDCIKFCSNL